MKEGEEVNLEKIWKNMGRGKAIIFYEVLGLVQ
jgi:hypothetical protein